MVDLTILYLNFLQKHPWAKSLLSQFIDSWWLMWYTHTGGNYVWMDCYHVFRFFFAHSFFELIDGGTTFKPIMKSTLTQVKDSLRIRTKDIVWQYKVQWVTNYKLLDLNCLLQFSIHMMHHSKSQLLSCNMWHLNYINLQGLLNPKFLT